MPYMITRINNRTGGVVDRAFSKTKTNACSIELCWRCSYTNDRVEMQHLTWDELEDYNHGLSIDREVTWHGKPKPKG